MAFVAKRYARTDGRTDGRTYRRCGCLLGSELAALRTAILVGAGHNPKSRKTTAYRRGPTPARFWSAQEQRQSCNKIGKTFCRDRESNWAVQ